MKCVILLITTILLTGCATPGTSSPTSIEPSSTSIVSSASTSSPSPSVRPFLNSSGPPVVHSSMSASNSSVIRHGEASWGPFKGHVVTRYPRGTIVRVCGKIGCTGRVASWGYGPAKRTGRIADLDVRVFEHVCGPRSMGVCQIKLEVWKQ